MSKLFELPGQTTLSRVVAVYEDKEHQVSEEYTSRASLNSCFLIQNGVIVRQYKTYAKRIVFTESRDDVDVLQSDKTVLFVVVPDKLFAELPSKEKCITTTLIFEKYSLVFKASNTFKTCALLLASSLYVTDLIVPWDVSTIVNLDIFPNIHIFSKDVFNEYFPKSYWVTNFIKIKNFDDRRICLSTMTKMIHIPPASSKVDEIVLIGDPLFLNTDRFRYDTTNHTLTRFVDGGSVVFNNVAFLVEWCQKNTDPGSIVILARQDTYLKDVGSHSLFQKIEKGRVYTINAIIIPDIPDPRPELVGRGNPLVAGACLIRFLDEPMVIDEPKLSKIGLFDHQVYTALSFEFMKKRYVIGNLSVPLTIYQSKNTQIFSGKESEALNRVSKTDVSVISFANKIFPPIIGDITICDFKGNPFFTRDSLYETVTLKNMTNKQLTRKKRTYWNLKDEAHTIPSTSISFCDLNGAYLINKATIHIKKKYAYDSWKRGSLSDELSLSRKFLPVPHDVLVIPRSSEETYFTAINTFSLIITQVLSNKQSNYYIDLQDDKLTNIPVWKECMEGYPFFKIERVNLHTMGLIGSAGSRVAMYPTEQSSVGFVPALVRRANELVYDAYSKRMDLKTDLFKDIDENPAIDGSGGDLSDKDVETDTLTSPSRPLGLILGEEWVSTLDKLCKKYRPDVEWRHYVDCDDIHFNDLTNVKYAVGTSTGTAWILSMLLNPKKASVIEIAKEHEYDPKWYHVTSSVGCNHAVLPLKTEPTKQCVDRIKKQLSVYFDELDKALTE